MNILFLNHNTQGRGTYVRCINLGRHLVELGHRVTLLTSAHQFALARREQVLKGVTVITMPEVFPSRVRNGGLGPIDTCARIGHVLRHRYDVVHAFDHRPAVSLPALAAKYARNQVLISEWTDLWSKGGIMDERPLWARCLAGQLEAAGERTMRRRADAITAICSELERRARTVSRNGCPVLRLPGGADIDTVQPLPIASSRRQLQLPENAKILVYVGFTQYDREFLLQAFAIVASQMEDAHLVLVGPKLADVAAHAASRRIHQTGVLTPAEMCVWLAAGNAMLLPFVNRGVNLGRWPNKVGDYMAAGRPIVSNRTGDLTGLFEKDEIGLLANDSPEDFARCSMELLNNPSLAKRMGANARALAEREYSWAKLSERLSDFYAKVLLVSPSRQTAPSPYREAAGE